MKKEIKKTENIGLAFSRFMDEEIGNKVCGNGKIYFLKKNEKGKAIGSAYVGTRGETSYQLVPTKKFCESPIELAEKYMPISGPLMLESTKSGTEMLISSLLSDTQEVLYDNAHYVEILNDIKSEIGRAHV